MLGSCRRLLKTSSVAVRATPSLTYEKRYRMLRRMTLSNSFNVVNESNRYTSLGILLERLSGYVGRRQYKLSADLTRLLPMLKEQQLDWHDIKALKREELLELLGDGLLQLNHAERAVMLTATTAKVCGVLRRSDTRHTENICLQKGLAEHGWRCGRNGHTRDVYFEGKQRLNPLALQLDRRKAFVDRVERRNGVSVEVRPAADFSIVGRLSHESNPRIWSSPTNAVFDVQVIGYEFRVHPQDPRAVPQIVEAAQEWLQHAEAIRYVLWEMLELYAVERQQQPLAMEPGEMGEPDAVNEYTMAFARRKGSGGARSAVPASSERSSDAPIREEDVVVEQVMVDATDHTERPWFMPPLEQSFTSNGIPEILPYAPTFMVRCTFRPLEHSMEAHYNEAERATMQQQQQQQAPHDEAEVVTKLLMQPVMEVTCFANPKSCYWISPEDEAKVMGHVVAYAQRLPFAVPFNLYLRVDPSRCLRGEAGERFQQEREDLLGQKKHWFDPNQFVDVHLRGGPDPVASSPNDNHAKGATPKPASASREEDSSEGLREQNEDDVSYFYSEPHGGASQDATATEASKGDDGLNPKGWE